MSPPDPDALFRIWAEVEPAMRVHPRDREVLRQAEGRHGFNLDCLPTPYSGRLRDAPVVVLYLVPGFHPLDLEHAGSQRGKELMAARRTGWRPLPDESEHADAARWQRARTRVFGEWERVRERIATLNIGAYHAPGLAGRDRVLLGRLPTSRATLGWARDVLFPQARSCERIVVCMRAAKDWGLEKGRHGQSLYVPETTRGGHMIHSEMRDAVVKAVQRAI